MKRIPYLVLAVVTVGTAILWLGCGSKQGPDKVKALTELVTSSLVKSGRRASISEVKYLKDDKYTAVMHDSVTNFDLNVTIQFDGKDKASIIGATPVN